jgi:quinol monooxygenase YgiN
MMVFQSRKEKKMFKMMTKFEVRDFDEWHKVFIAGESMRMDAGSICSEVYQCTGNPESVAVITEWEDMDKAKVFAQSAELRDAQKKAGTLTKPEVSILEMM